MRELTIKFKYTHTTRYTGTRMLQVTDVIEK